MSVRKMAMYDCSSADGTTVTITLSQPMKLLRADGTKDAPVSTIDLKMRDAVIMVIN